MVLLLPWTLHKTGAGLSTERDYSTVSFHAGICKYMQLTRRLGVLSRILLGNGTSPISWAIVNHWAWFGHPVVMVHPIVAVIAIDFE